jgi:methionyl-tRNA formyltransferase
MFEHIFLSSMNDEEEPVVDILRSLSSKSLITIISSEADLNKHAVDIKGRVLLISYDSGLIIPADILNALSCPAYNFHPAPPEYPGRDAHHFAVYEDVTVYGVTAHEMLPAVDAGQIVGVKRFPVPGHQTPQELFKTAQSHMLKLFEEIAPRLVSNEPPEPIGESWGKRKTTRKDFLQMCEISRDISHAEFSKRFKAFDGHRHDNLYTVIHGQKFRISKPPTNLKDKS